MLISSLNNGFCRSYPISSSDDYKKISKLILPGDEIIIADGTYSPWSLIIDLHGTAANPVIIKAKTSGKVIFTGETEQAVFKLTGSYTVLSGITFLSCNIIQSGNQTGVLVELAGTEACRLTDCRFEQNAAKTQFLPLVAVSGNGRHNRVDHCTFINSIDNMDVQVRVTKDATPQFTLIDNNLFQDKKKVSWPVFNGGECVQIGQDPVLLGIIETNTTVTENRFIRCNGEPEVISNKSSKNTYTKNYLEDCEGEIVMRGGHDCIINDNVIQGGNSGIRVNGTGHIIVRNTISSVKTGIRLMYGMAKSKAEIGFYIAASNCVIKNNIIKDTNTGILIGDSKNADWTGKFDIVRYPSRVMQDISPSDNVLGENSFTNVNMNTVTR